MFVCYNYADTFLHFYMKTHVSQTFVNCSKNSSIMEELLTSFGAQYGVNFLGETKLDFWPTDYRPSDSLGRAYKHRLYRCTSDGNTFCS